MAAEESVAEFEPRSSEWFAAVDAYARDQLGAAHVHRVRMLAGHLEALLPIAGVPRVSTALAMAHNAVHEDGLSSKRPCLQSASISNVRTLYVRNVPNRVYEALERRARRNGRSVNAEAIEILRAEAERGDVHAIVQQLAEIAEEIDWPDDAPMPEQLIREGRESR